MKDLITSAHFVAQIHSLPRRVRNASIYFALACGTGSTGLDVNTLAPFAGCTGDAEQVCLSLPDHEHYFWSRPGCYETGRVSYPLTFSPDTDSQLCMGTGYRQYEVEADWVPGGVSVVVDGSESYMLYE
jgi:hypothetical protein